MSCSGAPAGDPRRRHPAFCGKSFTSAVRRLGDTSAMDREQSPGAQERDVLVEGGEHARVARYIALEREKDQLRRERDHLILDLAASLGPAVLAQRFGVEAPVIAKLLEGAHGRLNS